MTKPLADGSTNTGASMPITPVGSEFTVNNDVDYRQEGSHLAQLANGRFVAVFFTDGFPGVELSRIAARLFSADGTPLAGQFDVPDGFDNGWESGVVGLPNGNFVITWGDDHDTAGGIRVKVFNNDGVAITGDIVLTQGDGGDYRAPAVTALSDGRFVVTWTAASETRGMILSAAGVALTEFQLSSGRGFTEVVGLGNGGFVASVGGVGYRVFNALGQPVGNDLSISGGSLTALPDGRFMVVGAHGANVYDSSGTLLSANSSRGFSGISDIATLSDGRVAMVYSTRVGEEDVHTLAVLNANGSLGSELEIGRTHYNAFFSPAVSGLSGGRVIVSWNEQGSDRYYDVHAQIFDAGAPGPTDGPDTWSGTQQADTYDGLGGNDTIDGLGGNDQLYGGQGNDTIIGGSGSDRMFGGAGDDTYYVDVADDVVDESAAGSSGWDDVYSSVSYTIGAGIEVRPL